MRSKYSFELIDYQKYFILSPHPFLEPQLHLACTSVGCVLGYMFHNFEEGSEERIQRLLEKHQQAPKQWAEFVKYVFIYNYSN